MREFRDNSVAFTCIKLNEQCNKMITAMQENHPALQITDLAQATQTKSAEEVTKMFVDSASFMLRAAVGGKAGGKAAGGRKAAKAGKPLWDPKKLAVGDLFSCISYVNVKKIEGRTVTVDNHLGGSWQISQDILERDMWSADHFEKEVKCTMSDLSELIQTCSDTIFRVQFRKKVDADNIQKKFAGFKFADLKKVEEVKKISKTITEGELVEVTGHLLESENNLGRSLVVDLDASKAQNIRSVDHRTIQFIIFRNVKYSLGRKVPGTEELPLKHDSKTPKWTGSKLSAGNWFSSSQYFKVKDITDKENCRVVSPADTTKELTMSRDILEQEMNSGGVYDKEEKLSRSEVVELMTNARECAFTVTFHKQLDEAYVKDVLANAPKDAFSNAAKLKALSKELTHGKAAQMTCFLTKSEATLGRSRVMDLNAKWGMNYR